MDEDIKIAFAEGDDYLDETNTIWWWEKPRLFVLLTDRVPLCFTGGGGFVTVNKTKSVVLPRDKKEEVKILLRYVF